MRSTCLTAPASIGSQIGSFDLPDYIRLHRNAAPSKRWRRMACIANRMEARRQTAQLPVLPGKRENRVPATHVQRFSATKPPEGIEPRLALILEFIPKASDPCWRQAAWLTWPARRFRTAAWRRPSVSSTAGSDIPEPWDLPWSRTGYPATCSRYSWTPASPAAPSSTWPGRGRDGAGARPRL